MAEIKRNDPCPCGSGKKYKKCCGVTPSARPHFYKKMEGDKSHVQKVIGLMSQTIENSSSGASIGLDNKEDGKREVKKFYDPHVDAPTSVDVSKKRNTKKPPERE